MSSFTLSQSDSEEELFRQCGGKNFRRNRNNRRANVIDTSPSPEARGYYQFREKHSVDIKERDTFYDSRTSDAKSPNDETIYPEEEGNSSTSDIVDEKSNYVVYFIIYMLIGYATGIVLVLIWYSHHFDKYGSDISIMWVLIVLLAVLIIILCSSKTFR